MALRHYNRRLPKYLRGNKVRNRVNNWFGEKTFFKCRKTFFRLKIVVKGRHWVKHNNYDDSYKLKSITYLHYKL